MIMKVDKLDIAWSVVSMIILGYAFYHHKTIYGLIAVYAIMVVIFYIHIMKMRQRTDGSIPVYATVTDYFQSKDKLRYSPIVKYETEDGVPMSSVYSIESVKKRYEIGSEQIICYSPQEPLFFYFADREGELVSVYYRFIIIGGILTAAAFIISQLT